jgi:protoporphyrinogen/coproporphyrinogen III oxidase
MPADNRTSPRIVVVGGGVAGLATAYLMNAYGRSGGYSPRITVLEAAAIPGGSTRTEIVDGFTCEWGPNGFLDNEPATLDLVARLGLTNRLVKADENSAHRFIYHGGKMREVPLKPPAFLVSDILPLSAKLRMALEFMIPAKRNGYEETVYAFGKRRLGKTFADLMLDPMVSGIFAGDAAALSLGAVFPKMVEMEREYGGLLKAMIAKQKESKRTGKESGGPGGAAATLHTFKNGMGELTITLAQNVGPDLQLNSPVSTIAFNEHEWHVEVAGSSTSADAVVLACPSYAAAKIVNSLSESAAAALRGIWHAPVDVVCHGYDQAALHHPLQGFGVLVPRSEGIRSLGSLWSDSIFPGQAPTGQRLLRTMIGGAHDPDIVHLSAGQIEQIARADLAQLVGAHEPPRFKRVIRHPAGIAQYTLGHRDRVDETEKLEASLPGLYFTGASYRGVSVNGCAKDAFRVAESFWKFWGKRA